MKWGGKGKQEEKGKQEKKDKQEKKERGNFQQSFLLCGLDGGFLCGILCFFLFASGIDDNDKPEGGISDAPGCVRKAAFPSGGIF